MQSRTASSLTESKCKGDIDWLGFLPAMQSLAQSLWYKKKMPL